MSIFRTAERVRVPVKLGLHGVSGSGKTYSALRLARGMAGKDGRIALVDTEHSSALEYADQFRFDHAEMVHFHPDNFTKAIRDAEGEGYDVLIIDGISPEWNGPGGIQEIVDKNMKGSNSFSGWAVGTPAHNKFLQGILSCSIPLIVTMRSKTGIVIDDKNRPVKVGLEPIQRDGLEYELTIVCALDLDHSLTVTKSRRVEIPVGEIFPAATEELGALIAKSSQRGGAPVATTPQGPQEPAPAQAEVTPEPPAPEPAAEVTASSESLLDVPAPEPAPTPEAPKAEDGLTLEQIEHLDKLATELKELRPDLDWLKKIDDAAERDYGKKAIELSPENGKALIEKLTNTRNQVRDQQQAGAPA